MNIYVGNLDFNLNEDELQQIFAEYGEVVSVKIVKDRETGRAKGFGFVEMADDSDAKTAIEELEGAEVKGRNIRVNEARPRPERPSHGGYGGGRPQRDRRY
jgi:RNA recognition motif-containing protein